MEHIFQDVVAVVFLLFIGIPLVRGLCDAAKREERGALKRGFDLGASGVRMSDFPDSLAGYYMYCGNRLYFGEMTPGELPRPECKKAAQLLAGRQ